MYLEELLRTLRKDIFRKMSGPTNSLCNIEIIISNESIAELVNFLPTTINELMSE